MARLDDLQAIEAAVWSELASAPRDRRHGWRVGVLATTDGQTADARHIVLRDVDAQRRQLVFYADSRSPKIRQIEAHPAGTLVLWCRELGWQLRLKVRLGVETSGLAVSSRWARLKMSPAAQDYLSPLPPGTPVAHPAPERGSREHFGVVTAHVDAIDWLELHADGHRRAAFDGQGRRWLTP
jgi:hypothetical protein